MKNPFIDMTAEATRRSVDSVEKLAAVNTAVFTKIAQFQIDTAGHFVAAGLDQAKRLQGAKSVEDLLAAGNAFAEASLNDGLARAQSAVALVAETRDAYLGLLQEAQIGEVVTQVAKKAA